jgi:hypothetical protein
MLFSNKLRGHTVCLYEDNQAIVVIIKNHTSSSPLTVHERVTSFDGLGGTTRHPISASVYPHDLNPAEFLKSISLDAFACPQSKVTSHFTSRHVAPEALAEDGLLLDLSSEVVCLNPPWALLSDVI